MGLYNNIPLFLDNDAGYTEPQVKQINIIVRNTRNKFISKATQKQKVKPKTEKFITNKYARVLNLRDYLLNNNFNISFILDPSGFVPNGSYYLFEFDNAIDNYYYEGSNSDDTGVIPLSNLGQITIDYSGVKPRFVFKCNDNTWPTDSGGNKLKYSVFISGRIK